MIQVVVKILLQTNGRDQPPPVDYYTSSESEYYYPWPEKTVQQIDDYEQWLNAEWDHLMNF